MYNKYIEAGRYDNLPISECLNIADSLDACIYGWASNKRYVDDARERLEALEHRIRKG